MAAENTAPYRQTPDLGLGRGAADRIRPPAEPEFVIAVDWGGTWNRVNVVDRNGTVHWENRVANSLSRTTGELVANGERVMREALDWCGDRPVAGIGLAMAGPIDPETGVLDRPPNLMLLDGVSLKTLWEPLFGLPVWVGNDADLAALGEYYFGAGRTDTEESGLPRTLAYLTISTGVGGGVVYRGQVFLGASGMAAEIGHMAIESGPDGPLCQCGSRGCLESLASGTAIARMARERLAESGSAASVLATEHPEHVTSGQVFQAAAQGDPLALGIIDRVVDVLGVGLTNVLHLYNPDVLVIGGGVSDGIQELDLLPRIHSLMLERAMSGRHREFRFELSRLQGSGGMLGAAMLVWLNSATA